MAAPAFPNRYRVEQMGIQWAIVDAQRGVVLALCMSQTTAVWVCGLMNAAVA